MRAITEAVPLVDRIAAHLAEWETPHVELAIYGTADPRSIAETLGRFCADTLGSAIAEGIFHSSSIGSVTGVALADGRRVVVKAHQPDRDVSFLEEVVRLQRHFQSSGIAAPAVLVGPRSLGCGHAIVEEFVDGGAIANGHVPEIRRALAEQLAAIVGAGRAQASRLPVFRELPATLYSPPHSKLFDFDATAANAEYIDDIARAARRILSDVDDAGDMVIGHGDLRAEHVRFDGLRPAAVFDWDSVQMRREPALVGAAAHAFCADWARGDGVAPAPTLDEARAFVADYVRARERAFDLDERRLLAAAFAYAVAYTARCGHALGTDGRHVPGTFAHLAWREGSALTTL